MSLLDDVHKALFCDKPNCRHCTDLAHRLADAIQTHVLVPREPTYHILKALAGNPILLAASDEQELRIRWDDMLSAAEEK